MLEPIGYIGYIRNMRVLDTLGLVSPQVLQYYRQSNPSPYHAIWQAFHPDWILLRAGERAALIAYENALPPGQRLAAQYTLQRTFPASKPAFWLYHANEKATAISRSGSS